MPSHTPAAIKALMGRSTRRGSRGNDPTNSLTRTYRRELGQWLAQHRQEAGLTQARLAELICDQLGEPRTELTNTAISSVENASRGLAPEVLEAAAKVMHLDPVEQGKWLLGLQNPWLYRMLFTCRGRPDVQQRIEQASSRQRRPLSSAD